MEFDGQSEIPESGIKEAVMSTADHGSDHRTVIHLQRDRGIFEMTAEGTRPVRTESRVRIIKVIKSQGAAHTCIQIPITNPECPIPSAAAARPADDGVRTRSRQRTHNVSEGTTGKMSVGSKVESSPCIRL